MGDDAGGGGGDRGGGGLGLVRELGGKRSENLVVDRDGSLFAGTFASVSNLKMKDVTNSGRRENEPDDEEGLEGEVVREPGRKIVSRVLEEKE